MEERQCLLVIIGATRRRQKKNCWPLTAAFSGEWICLGLRCLIDLKHRGLKAGSKTGYRWWLPSDSGKPSAKAYGNTRWQRCWVHKTANVLNKLPKSIQAKAKEKLHQIWMAPDKEEAQRHFDEFISIYEAKYPQATKCLLKDREVLLTFYDFPAEHWRHIRTTNP